MNQMTPDQDRQMEALEVECARAVRATFDAYIAKQTGPASEYPALTEYHIRLAIGKALVLNGGGYLGRLCKVTSGIGLAPAKACIGTYSELYHQGVATGRITEE
jgi:hypothetical protein